MKPPWFPPNRKPANWEEASANKMAYYLDLKKIWDKQIEARSGKPVRLCPGGPAWCGSRREIEAGKVPGMNTFFDTIFSDNIHLAPPGHDLVALVHYACIFGAGPAGQGDVCQQRPDRPAGSDLPAHRLGDGRRRAAQRRTTMSRKRNNSMSRSFFILIGTCWCSTWGAVAAPPVAFEHRTPYYRIGLARQGLLVESLDVDSLGQGKVDSNLLGGAAVEKARLETSEGRVVYRLPQAAEPGTWEFRFAERTITLVSRLVPGQPSPPLVLRSIRRARTRPCWGE